MSILVTTINFANEAENITSLFVNNVSTYSYVRKLYYTELCSYVRICETVHMHSTHNYVPKLVTLNLHAEYRPKAVKFV